MPRRRMEYLFVELKRYLATNCNVGERFPTSRDIAQQFGVSVQLAHKAVGRLIEAGYLSQSPHRRPVVRSLDYSPDIGNRRVVLFSNNHDMAFIEGFAAGIEPVLQSESISLRVSANYRTNLDSIEFGEHLLSLGADAVIALNFKSGGLGFYHALREGMDIVSDLPIPGLPLVHTIHPENYRIAEKTAELLLGKDFKRVLAAAPYKIENKRFRAVRSVLARENIDLTLVDTRLMDSESLIDRFFYDFNARSAICSLRYLTNLQLAAKCIQHRVKITEYNFVAYEIPRGTQFHFEGLPPIRGSGFSFELLGGQLARHLITKWKTGAYPSKRWDQPIAECAG